MHRHRATALALAATITLTTLLATLTAITPSARAQANTDPSIDLIPVDTSAIDWTQNINNAVDVDLVKTDPREYHACYLRSDGTTPETHRLIYARTLNLGRSWTTQILANDADTNSAACAIANTNGTLVIAYRNTTYDDPANDVYDSATSAIKFLRSDDEGDSWSPLSALLRQDPGDTDFGKSIALATWPNGNLVMSVARTANSIQVYRSTNQGTSWTHVRNNGLEPGGFDSDTIATERDQEWGVFGGNPSSSNSVFQYTVDNGVSISSGSVNGGTAVDAFFVPGSNDTLYLSTHDADDGDVYRVDNVRTTFDVTTVINRNTNAPVHIAVNNEGNLTAWAGLPGTGSPCTNCIVLNRVVNDVNDPSIIVDENAKGGVMEAIPIGNNGGGLLYYRPTSNTGDLDDTGGLYFAFDAPEVTQRNNATGFVRITKVETDYRNTASVYIRDNGGSQAASTLSKFTANLGSGFEVTECSTPYQEAGFVEAGLVITTDDFVAHPCEVDPDNADFFFNTVILARNRNLGQVGDVETCNRATDLASNHGGRVAWIAQSIFQNDNCADDNEELFGVVNVDTETQVCNGAAAVGSAIRVSTSGDARTNWFFTHGSGGLSQYDIDTCELAGGDFGIGGFGVKHLAYNRADPKNLSQHGELVAHDSGNDEIVHYNITTNGDLEVIERINVADGTPYHSVLGLSGSKDGAYFFSWTATNATIWDTATDQAIVHLTGQGSFSDPVRWMATDVLNNNLYVANDTEVRVYDVSAFTDAFGVDNEGPNTGPDPFSNPFLEQETAKTFDDAGAGGDGGEPGTGGTLVDPATVAPSLGVDESLAALFLAILVIIGFVGMMWKFTESATIAGTVGGVGGLLMAYAFNLVPNWVIALVFAVVAGGAVLMMRRA